MGKPSWSLIFADGKICATWDWKAARETLWA